MKKKTKIIIAVAVVVAAAVAATIFFISSNSSALDYCNGKGEKISVEEYSKIYDTIDESRTEIEVNGMTCYRGKTTLNEFVEAGFIFKDSDDLNAKVGDNATHNYYLENGSKDSHLGFLSLDENNTFGEAVLDIIIDIEGVSVEGMNIEFGKTTVKDIIDNGWELAVYYRGLISDDGKMEFASVFFTKDGKGIRFGSDMKTDADINTAVINGVG